MSMHTQEKEALQESANLALTYRGIKLGTLDFVQKDGWLTNPDASITGPGYAPSVFKIGPDAKRAIDALLAGQQPPVTSPVDPPVTPPTNPSIGTFQYLRGMQVIPPSWPTAQPALGGSFVDPFTGATIQRISDASKIPGDGGGLRNVYSRYSCENADGTLWLAQGIGSPAAWLVRVADNTVMRAITDAQGKAIGEPAELHWDYRDPDTFYFVRDMGFFKQSASTGKTTLVRDFAKDFPDATFIMNDVEGDSSHDSRYWCWMAMKSVQAGSFPVLAIFTYDQQTDAILGTMTFANWGLPQGATDTAGYMPRPNMVEVSPDGSFALIDWSRCWQSGNQQNNANLVGTHADGPHVYPLTLDTAKAVKVGVDATHSAWAANAAGKWLFVSQNSRNDFIEAVDPAIGWDANDGPGVTRLIYHGDLGWNNGFHFCGARDLRGWVCLGTESTSQIDPGDNQVMLLPLMPNGAPLRICPTYNVHKDYFSETNPSLSMDGTRIYWHGTWDGTKPIDTFRVQLPEDWQTKVQP